MPQAVSPWPFTAAALEFELRPIHVSSVVAEVALGETSLPVQSSCKVMSHGDVGMGSEGETCEWSV